MATWKMSNKRIRDVQRATHLSAALLLALYIYLPLGSAPLLTEALQFVVLPVLGLSGLLMWQWPRLRKWLTGTMRSVSRLLTGKEGKPSSAR